MQNTEMARFLLKLLYKEWSNIWQMFKFFKSYYSVFKRHTAINPYPKYLPSVWTHLSHHTCHFLQEFWSALLWVSLWCNQNTMAAAAERHPRERRASENISVCPHLPCSPDRAPATSGSSSKSKWLRKTRFESIQDTEAGTRAQLKTFMKDNFQN